MSQRVQGTLIGLAIMLVFAALGVRRRMHPQPVRPNRILFLSVIILLLLSSTFIGTSAHLVENPLTIALAPAHLVAGIALGFVLVRTMRFWTASETGQPWMAGGALFAIIVVGAILASLRSALCRNRRPGRPAEAG